MKNVLKAKIAAFVAITMLFAFGCATIKATTEKNKTWSEMTIEERAGYYVLADFPGSELHFIGSDNVKFKTFAKIELEEMENLASGGKHMEYWTFYLIVVNPTNGKSMGYEMVIMSMILLYKVDENLNRIDGPCMFPIHHPQASADITRLSEEVQSNAKVSEEEFRETFRNTFVKLSGMVI